MRQLRSQFLRTIRAEGASAARWFATSDSAAIAANAERNAIFAVKGIGLKTRVQAIPESTLQADANCM